MPYSLAETLAWLVEQRVAEEPGFAARLKTDPLPFLRLVLGEVLGDDDPQGVIELASTIDLSTGSVAEALRHVTVEDPVALAVDCREIEYEVRRMHRD